MVDVRIEKAAGCKCERCRQYDVAVGRIWKWPEVCHRCAKVMDALEDAVASYEDTGEMDPLYGWFIPLYPTKASFKEAFQDPYLSHPIRAFTPNKFGEVWGTPDEMPWITYQDGVEGYEVSSEKE